MKITILATFILFTSLTVAQEIKFGIKGGINLSSLRGDFLDEINEKSKIGYHAGAFLEYSFNTKFSIQPELLLSTQGGESDVQKYEGAQFYFGINPIPKLTYMNMPILLKYKLVEKLSIEIGPQIGYLLKAQSKIEYIDPSNNYIATKIDILNGGKYTILDNEVEIEPGVNRFDYGLNFGTSYKLTERLFLQARYYLGLAVVDKPSVRNVTYDYQSKNSVLQFSLGYMF